MKQKILVWDIPTRLFHWLLALSFTGAFLTAESERLRDIHVLLGYTFGGLIVFRLLWGLVGTRYAKFRSLFFKWTEIRGYLASLLTREPRHYLGHNPAGSLTILFMLALGALITITGYAVYDISDAYEDVHEVVANVMLALVFIHILGVIVSSFLHRENLVRSMVDGRKVGEPNQGIGSARAWVGVLLIVAVIVFWFVYPV